MIPRPRSSDFKNIAHYTGKVVFGIGLLMIIPLGIALIFQEWNPALDFLIGMFSCFAAGLFLQIFFYTERDLNWLQGLVVASFSWILATMFGAIPHYLSGHFGCYVDACFDLMSGYTTTGLYLLQDLDHISYALNTWRHILSYAGGQGIIVIALTFLVKGTGGAFKMYVAEGREEKLLPNIIQTARVIWLISLSYLAVGSMVLWGIAVHEGMSVTRGLLHGIWVFMGSWSTGGFAPQSFNISYYHSFPLELVTIILFVLGSFNFALHWAVWTGNKKEIYRNIEIISFCITITIILTITSVGLMRLGVYPNLMALFRKGFYHVISGHTTTGFMTIQGRTFVKQWGEMAMLGITLAMAIGASACSTAGGFKGLRIGLIFKTLTHDIKKILTPETAVVIEKFHHIKDTVLSEKHVRGAMLIVILFITSYTITTIVGVYCGYPFIEALFDGVSAGSNTGLSCGVTSPSMPMAMKLVYIVTMWLGRLEFMSVFAFIGFIIATVRGE
ncbi:potassium transporter TrkG [Candidatus Oleimmundimicrobium sp.]|uniref:TrkH family potassium uptake protein n=1 Tax=Candidatus Oleimmundimicrobium sp. TaxID=3060597 RepID=UPI00272220F0|nr:potassium transporter TrkG [Candidatus Oleimmundimicrobium sp.]MDO8886845.1 potassium transporter TrkG [Candidatus Oleimmundimicrobium sp.]